MRQTAIRRVASATMLLLLCGRAANADDPIRLLVPAYANPCCGSGRVMWDSLVRQAERKTRTLDLHIILNPASGPGVGIDPNFVSSAGDGPLPRLHRAGVVIHGYVATGFGNRQFTGIEEDIEAYLIGPWSKYVTGIFLDEMSNDTASADLYKRIDRLVKKIRPTARTFGNLGTRHIINPTGQTSYVAKDLVDAVDTVVTFEDKAERYLELDNRESAAVDVESDSVAHIVHTTKNWDDRFVEMADQFETSFVYFTDDIYLNPSTDNPYDKLPTYFDEMIGVLERR